MKQGWSGDRIGIGIGIGIGLALLGLGACIFMLAAKLSGAPL